MIKRLLFLTITILFSMNFIGCSYVMDSVEGAIMDRASFSITNGSYNSGVITLKWGDQTSTYKTDSENVKEFAGYEIYMTHNPNSEYEKYDLIAAIYNFEEELPAGISYVTTATLLESGTHTFNITSPTNTGIYFFRIGVITADVKSQDANKKDLYYDVSLNGNQSNYKDYTSLDKISGSYKIKIQ